MHSTTTVTEVELISSLGFMHCANTSIWDATSLKNGSQMFAYDCKMGHTWPITAAELLLRILSFKEPFVLIMQHYCGLNAWDL